LEAQWLDAIDDTQISLAYDRMLGAFPRLSTMTRYEQMRSREDLRWMARFTAAAVLTRDPGILDEFLSWLCSLLDGRVPVTVITTSAHLVAETVEPDAPYGAQLLHEAATRAAAAPSVRSGPEETS
jgi:hypothetical protein